MDELKALQTHLVKKLTELTSKDTVPADFVDAVTRALATVLNYTTKSK